MYEVLLRFFNYRSHISADWSVSLKDATTGGGGGLTNGRRGSWPLNIFIDPQFWTELFIWWGRFNYVIL